MTKDLVPFGEVHAREDAVRAAGDGLRAAFQAIAQPRSNFALRHFVIAQHDTPARQWAQAILELRIRIFNIARVQSDAALLTLDLEDADKEASSAPDERAAARARLRGDKLRIDVEEANVARLGNVQEAEELLAIVRELEERHGGPYTREQIEADEPRYWSLRLRRQARNILRGTMPPGDAEAFLQTMVDVGEERPPLLGENEVAVLMGIDPPQEMGRLLKEQRAIAERIEELRLLARRAGGSGPPQPHRLDGRQRSGAAAAEAGKETADA